MPSDTSPPQVATSELLQLQAHIASEYADVHSLARRHPGPCLNKARTIAEAICCAVYAKQTGRRLDEGKAKGLQTFINKLRNDCDVPVSIVKQLNSVREYGNYGSHHQGEPIPPHIVSSCLFALDAVYTWYQTTHLVAEPPTRRAYRFISGVGKLAVGGFVAAVVGGVALSVLLFLWWPAPPPKAQPKLGSFVYKAHLYTPKVKLDLPASYPVERQRLIKVQLQKTKRSGKLWDGVVAVPGAMEPDIYIKLGARSYRQERCEDSYTCSFRVDGFSGGEIAIWDADLKNDDHVETLTCSPGRTCAGRSATVTVK